MIEIISLFSWGLPLLDGGARNAIHEDEANESVSVPQAP